MIQERPSVAVYAHRKPPTYITRTYQQRYDTGTAIATTIIETSCNHKKPASILPSTVNIWWKRLYIQERYHSENSRRWDVLLPLMACKHAHTCRLLRSLFRVSNCKLSAWTNLDHELSNAQSERIVQGVFDTIVENVSDGKRVTLHGFGAFFSIRQKERSGTSPQGIDWHTAAKDVPKFKAMTGFRDAVEESGGGKMLKWMLIYVSFIVKLSSLLRELNVLTEQWCNFAIAVIKLYIL